MSRTNKNSKADFFFMPQSTNRNRTHQINYFKKSTLCNFISNHAQKFRSYPQKCSQMLLRNTLFHFWILFDKVHITFFCGQRKVLIYALTFCYQCILKNYPVKAFKLGYLFKKFIKVGS